VSLFERRLALSNDPFALARALSGRPGVFLVFAEYERVVYVGCDPVATSSELDPEPELGLARGMVAGAAPRWVGCLPYEACRGLERELKPDPRPVPHLSAPLWLRYGAVARVGEEVHVLGDDARAVSELSARLLRAQPAGSVRLGLAAPFEPAAAHAARIEHALVEIAAGNVYEVNLARRLELAVEGTPWDLLAALGESGLPPHAFALRAEGLDVCAISPELCLRLEPDRRLVTRPIKGTRPRSQDPAADSRLARELDQDPKECAELTMILDVERNDLGRVSVAGSVRLKDAPHVVSLPSVHHRLATLEAELRPEVSRAQLLDAFLPSGSVTGAPKRRAMQLIAELEPHRRGLYTGAVGFLRRDGGLELAMAIRTLTVRDGLGHYYTGGGIVADSVPALEVEETLWKAERVLQLLRRSATSAAG
jgi:anthranilate/para-aminobenzoate synthase component I